MEERRQQKVKLPSSGWARRLAVEFLLPAFQQSPDENIEISWSFDGRQIMAPVPLAPPEQAACEEELRASADSVVIPEQVTILERSRVSGLSRFTGHFRLFPVIARS